MKRLLLFALCCIFLCSCSIQPSESTTASIPAPQEILFDPYEIVDAMSDEELVGQLFLARCPSDETAVTDVSKYHLAGYVLFGRDFQFESPYSVRKVIASYQKEAKIPLLIAVDEEGGNVCRISQYPIFRHEPFPSNRDVYDLGGMTLLAQNELEKCELLSDLGINVNIGPVCDITTDPSAYIYDRAIGQPPDITGQCVATIVGVMQESNIGSVLKHFPGYGNNTDTHTGIAVDLRPLEQLEQHDLIPFQYGIEAGCGAVMLTHTVITALDAELPASLSPAVVKYLRNEMSFSGVIITDDLVMEAITRQYGDGEAAVLAVLAGNDLLCSSEYQVQYNAVLDALNDGRIPRERIREATAKVIQWKYQLGLLA